MKRSAPPFVCHFKPSIVGAVGLCLALPVNASVPLLPAFVFDELFVQDEVANVPPPSPYANLTDELLPAPAIDSVAVSQTLDALRASYQEAEQLQAIMSKNGGKLPDDLDLTALPDKDDTPVFVTFSELDSTVNRVAVSRLGDKTPPLGLNTDALPTKPTPNQTAQTTSFAPPTKQGINPDEHLPAYQASNLSDTPAPNETVVVKKSPNLLKRTYQRFFKDGEGVLSKIDSKIYLAIPNEVAQNEAQNITDTDESSENAKGIFADNWQFESERLASIDIYNQNVSLQAVDLAVEPFKNIANALANVSEASVNNFAVALPRLREIVTNASRAVGYYDVSFNLKQEPNGTVAVVIYDLGKPVLVTGQVVDIRGAGATLPKFEQLKETARPKVGQAFHHGEYEATKTAIDETSAEHGFFDAKWLGNTADVLLPDNTADIGLVYDTGEQYVFDEVVFFTLDPATGQLTTDPDKLPVKLSLLKKMVAFKPNDPFVRSKVNQLSNGLLATRYFNASNVEAVMPDRTGDSGVAFAQESPNANDTASTPTPQDDLPLLNPTDNSTPLLDETGQVLGSISPIDFSPSQAIVEKVALVKGKAERLLASPDDRVLDEGGKRSLSVLGQVSDTIQKIAQYLLPDESKDGKPTLAEGETPPTLAHKKTPQAVFTDKKIPLYVFVVADKPKDWQLGLGYGTESGWRATTRFENHLMNNKGFQSGVEFGASKDSRTANAYISRPITHPVNDKTTASIKFDQQKIAQKNSGFDLTARSMETALTRTRIQENSWHKSYALRYRLDSLTTQAPPSTWQDLPVRFLASGTHQEALLAGFAMSKSTQNSLTAPTLGYRQSYSLEAGSKKAGSDANMAIVRAGLGGMVSFGNNQWGANRANQVIGRLDLGYLWTDNFDKVPYRLRFFAGGDQSVRGYNFESLSPMNNGYLTGGQALAVGSIEYNRELMDGIRGAMFADVGGAYDKAFKNDTKLGVGVGVRWASPIGSVRFDVAKGIDDDEQETPVRVYFLIGVPF